MDFGRISELSLRIQHRHTDGTWGDLEPSDEHHDPAEHDPEQEWGTGTLYLCKACGEGSWSARPTIRPTRAADRAAQPQKRRTTS